MAPQKRTAYGINYYSYSLHDWRALRSLKDIPRSHWSGLYRKATNFEWRNRYDYRDGAWPQKGGVDHIGAGFQDNVGADTGAEALNEYGLNPNNTRASWNAGGDSDTLCLLLPGDTRPWQHGIANPYGIDMNSLAVGYEDGILSTDWRTLPRAKRIAHLRMRATFWALFFGDLKWPLIYTPDANEVFRLANQGRSWGLTQHGIIDWNNRTDAGLLWSGGGRKINTFPYSTPVSGDPSNATLFAMIQEEMAIRAGAIPPKTPGLPEQPSDKVKALQSKLNELGYNLDVDGFRGPLTDAAADEVLEFTGWTGKKTDHNALMAHLEDLMAKLDDLYNSVKNVEKQNAKLLKQQDAQYKSLLNRTSKKWIGEGVWSYKLYGFVAHWWLRLGMILDPKHKNFPADPGSPADRDLRAEAALSEDDRVEIYLPEGQTALRLDPETNKFVFAD